ncbi:MAG: tetratricopeptide repeat protein [Betaproteobacteria bacterium]|nr:tetratricopeptide repeat protein [Betaproteobacteria bacterium]
MFSFNWIEMKHRKTVLALLAVTACNAALLSAAEPTRAKAAAQVEPVPAEGSSGGLTDQILYQYLISEIAGQRGRTSLAMRGLMDLAEKTRDARVARRAVEVAFQARELGMALQATTLWLEIDPSSSVARQALGALSSGQSTLEDAQKSLAPLLAEPERAPRMLMQLNAFLARFPDKPAVAEVVKTLAAPHSKVAEAQFAIAQAHFNAKNMTAALKSIDAAEQRRPGWSQAAILKSQVLREQSEDKAREYLENYVARYPSVNEVRVTLARLLVAQKSYLSAREQFRTAMKYDSRDTELPYAVGLLAQQIEDFADAEIQFKRVLELSPADANPVRFNLGLVAEGRKQPDDAVMWYRAVTSGEYFVNAQLKIAGIFAKRDGMTVARKFLKDAQAAVSDAPETQVQLILAEAQLLRDAKSHSDAFSLLSGAIVERPDTADLLYDRAMVAEKIDKLDVMEADLRRVIELKPEHAHAYNALGYTLADRNIRLQEAYELVQKAIKLAPADVFIQDSLGWILYRLGRFDEALQTLSAAYETKRDPEIAAHLGEVMWTKGARDEALKLWRTSLAENPENETLASVLRKYQP